MEQMVREAVTPLVEKRLSEQRVEDGAEVGLLARWLALAAPQLDRSRDLAVQLLEWSGGASGLALTPPKVVAERWGLSLEAVEGLLVAARFGASAVLSPAPLVRVTGSRSVFDRFARLGRHPRETFWILGLGARNHVLIEERVAEGAANLCALLPRDVLRPLVGAGAIQAVLIHNHPSGDPTPSAEDLDLTRRIGAAGNVVGVGILDHVIIGAGTWTSLLDEGLMEVPE
jgi:DNA repair protein RadC